MSPVVDARRPAPRDARIVVLTTDPHTLDSLRAILVEAGYRDIRDAAGRPAAPPGPAPAPAPATTPPSPAPAPATPPPGPGGTTPVATPPLPTPTQLLAQQPDLLVVDLALPTAAEDLIADLAGQVPDADFRPILVVDADATHDNAQVRAALRAGAHDYVRNPFDPAEVRLRVGNLLLTRSLHVHQSEANHELSVLVRARAQDIDTERRFLRGLLDCLDVGILACDARGVPVLSNAAIARLQLPPQALGPQPGAKPPRSGNVVTLRSGDGRHELAAEDRPLARALRGELVHGEELVVVDASGGVTVVVANAAPLVDEDGTSVGAVLALHDITERRRAEDELRRMALHDGLTDLPNRTLFLDRLDQALQRRRRDPRPVAVLFIDVDHFKVVNDTLGHAAGDELLVRLAERLRQAVRPGDTAARLGGDEFVVLCEAPVDVDAARRIAARIEHELGREMPLADTEFRPQVSVGITVVDEGERTATEVLRDADAAMFAAKQTGGGRHEVFDQILRGRLMERLDIAGSLHSAIQGGELSLHYQPTIDLTTGRICGAEALARWVRPGGETIPPDRFIPVAEQTGMITSLGSWVIAEACEQLAAWNPELPEDFTLAVNVSAVQLTHPGLVTDVERTLDLTGVDPTRLCLELTETALVDNPQQATRTLADLRELGLRLAVDDFGTGQSSLAYLRNFPISIVKIDREFVGGMAVNRADAAIVTAVVELGHRLGLITQAEGVENPAQVAMLRDLGCELAQGYYYSAAVPAATLRSMLVGL